MTSGRRKILFLTGDRAEYDIQFPLIEAACRSSEFEPLMAVAGSHLAERFGYTIREIEADGFPIAARIENLVDSDEPAARAKSAGLEITALADVVSQVRPDFLCIMGDREDTIAGATVGVYAQVPVIHIGGGDRSDDGNSDNSIRDAVTKLSHIHLAASQQSAARVIALGEDEWRVANVGAPGLDRLASVETLSDAELWSRIGVRPPDGPIVLMIQHPLLPEHDQARSQIIETLEALVAIDVPVFISRPNSDPGNIGMIAVLEEYAARHPRLHLFRNLGRVEFVNLLRRAGAMAGNSSAGILEAPFLKLPVVNIGRRQLGREHADNVVFVDHDRAAIEAAVRTSLYDENRWAAVRASVNPYGDGRAGEKALAFIATVGGDRRRLLLKAQKAMW